MSIKVWRGPALLVCVMGIVLVPPLITTILTPWTMVVTVCLFGGMYLCIMDIKEMFRKKMVKFLERFILEDALNQLFNIQSGVGSVPMLVLGSTVVPFLFVNLPFLTRQHKEQLVQSILLQQQQQVPSSSSSSTTSLSAHDLLSKPGALWKLLLPPSWQTAIFHTPPSATNQPNIVYCDNHSQHNHNNTHTDNDVYTDLIWNPEEEDMVEDTDNSEVEDESRQDDSCSIHHHQHHRPTIVQCPAHIRHSQQQSTMTHHHHHHPAAAAPEEAQMMMMEDVIWSIGKDIWNQMGKAIFVDSSSLNQVVVVETIGIASSCALALQAYYSQRTRRILLHLLEGSLAIGFTSASLASIALLFARNHFTNQPQITNTNTTTTTTTTTTTCNVNSNHPNTNTATTTTNNNNNNNNKTSKLIRWIQGMATSHRFKGFAALIVMTILGKYKYKRIPRRILPTKYS